LHPNSDAVINFVLKLSFEILKIVCQSILEQRSLDKWGGRVPFQVVHLLGFGEFLTVIAQEALFADLSG
jgi:hypothetical protein